MRTNKITLIIAMGAFVTLLTTTWQSANAISVEEINADRGKWTCDTLSQAVSDAGKGGGIIHHSAHAFEANLMDADGNPIEPKVIEYKFQGESCDRIPNHGKCMYNVWAGIHHGTFVNKGDGGFINWCFEGHSARDGNKVTWGE